MYHYGRKVKDRSVLHVDDRTFLTFTASVVADNRTALHIGTPVLGYLIPGIGLSCIPGMKIYMHTSIRVFV